MRDTLRILSLLVFVLLLSSFPLNAGEVILLTEEQLDAVHCGQQDGESRDVEPEGAVLGGSDVVAAGWGSAVEVQDKEIELDSDAQQLINVGQNQNVSSKGYVGQVLIGGNAAKGATAEVLQVLAGSQAFTAVNVASVSVETHSHATVSITQQITFHQR